MRQPDFMLRNRKLYSRLASVARWLHVYLSMFGFAALLLFSVTGLTLNHPGWFAREVRRTLAGEMPLSLLAEPTPARLEIIEHLRSTHGVPGAVSDFTADEHEFLVAFKGPGYAADVFIDRTTGAYDGTEVRQGTVALLNDLHKGRHTGNVWSWVIDLSAIGMVLISLTGFVLLFFIRRRRRSGLVVALAGLVAIVLIAWMIA
jgi:hypothetical protein